ncbi:MAG: hypothetical protein CL868_01840 [Cytophagaceae bacterium]|nr:hypothetical protein [Cytophagaceae bacterium]|tara:strand:+ start:7508 stop:7960 length:453 start_codon:yes stop_codon:yes gene_type:complete
MQSKISKTRKVSKAELKFREAFERLKAGKPNIMPKGTPMSQNNVAREAGVDPSALRRARFPELVSDIQAWIEVQKDEAPQVTKRQMMLSRRSRNRELREKIQSLKEQRDKALGLLLDAQTRLVELTLENQRLRAQQPLSDVHYISGSKKT